VPRRGRGDGDGTKWRRKDKDKEEYQDKNRVTCCNWKGVAWEDPDWLSKKLG